MGAVFIVGVFFFVCFAILTTVYFSNSETLILAVSIGCGCVGGLVVVFSDEIKSLSKFSVSLPSRPKTITNSNSLKKSKTPKTETTKPKTQIKVNIETPTTRNKGEKFRKADEKLKATTKMIAETQKQLDTVERQIEATKKDISRREKI